MIVLDKTNAGDSGAGGKLVKKLLKYQKIVKNSKKSQKPKKL